MSAKGFKKSSDWKDIPDEDLDFMSSASAAVLQQAPRGGKILLWTVSLFVVFFIAWTALAHVDEFTRGEGKVIPSQYVQVIQNLEGGILAELKIQEGDIVERGQDLLRIDDKRFVSSLREADVTLSQLQIGIERLRAEAESSEFRIKSPELYDASVLEREKALYDSRQNELVSNRQVFTQQLKQKEQELSELIARRNQLSESHRLLKKELELTKPLADSGAISEVELLRLERQVNDMYGEFQGAKLAVPRVQAALEESKEKLSNIDIVFRREARQQLGELTLELSQLTESSGALADRVQRTLVKSPVAGTVKRLLVKTIGGVIQPGMDIAEIVPSEEVLLVEARVRPADIAYLHPGQTAKIKFTAYDFAIYSGLEGQLVHISPDTIVNEEGDSYYLVRVETSKAFVGPDGAELPIIPGMTVSVDILTGKKTILDYILKPILKTKQLALRER